VEDAEKEMRQVWAGDFDQNLAAVRALVQSLPTQNLRDSTEVLGNDRPWLEWLLAMAKSEGRA
jgi:hypothetical protein